MHTDDPTIKPCPFCGAPAELDHQYFANYPHSRVRCIGADAHTLDSWEYFEKDAVIAWNARV